MTNMLDIELRLFCKTSVDKPTLQFRKQTHIGPGNALGRARLWSEWQDVPIEVEQDEEGVIPVKKPATTNEAKSIYEHLPVATGYVISDDDIDAVFNSMPDGPQGFCKTWGYRDFAKKLMALVAERLVK